MVTFVIHNVIHNVVHDAKRVQNSFAKNRKKVKNNPARSSYLEIL